MSEYAWDPLEFYGWGWPDRVLYTKQIEVLRSLEDNKETVVPAGHQLGKDYICAVGILWFFCTREPCRVVCTSVDMDSLDDVLWGEIRDLASTCRYRLPLIIMHRKIKKLIDKRESDKSYVIAKVAKRGEGMTGHHLARGPGGQAAVLGVFDESSGIDHETYSRLDTCTHKNLVVGNPYDCDNFFKWAVKGKPGSKDKGGDIPDGNGNYLRKIIGACAEDSPNVQYAIAEIKAGLRRPEELLVLNEDQPWGVYSKGQYETLMKAWNNGGSDECKMLL